MRRYLPSIVFLAVILIAAPSYALTLVNPSFEKNVADNWVTSIDDYSLNPTVDFQADRRAGNFFSYEGFTARNGDAFAAITNNMGGNQALVSSAFTLDEPGFHQLTFQYVYLTKNEPGDTTHKDPFTVTLYEDGTNTQLASWTVSDVDDGDLAAGDVDALPFQPQGQMTDTYDTDWESYRLELQDYLGKTVYLSFRIEDSAVGGLNSGFFLDQLVMAPEPGTFFLFGAGLLGLTLYGRRKRRRGKRA